MYRPKIFQSTPEQTLKVNPLNNTTLKKKSSYKISWTSMSNRLWGIKKCDISKAQMRFGPITSCLQYRRSNQLSYGALHSGEAAAMKWTYLWTRNTTVCAPFTCKHGANLPLSCLNCATRSNGKLAQMVERTLCMQEVPGSMPGFSTLFFFISLSAPFWYL